MKKQAQRAPATPSADADLLKALFDKADQVLVKKLSNNDRDWSRLTNKHQAGVYIPHTERDSGFFPPLLKKERKDPESDEIREAWFKTIWPQASGEQRRSKLVHYTSKGQETHMTRLPGRVFAELLPASFLVMGRVGTGQEYAFECLTIDSGSDEVGYLVEIFALDANFLIGIFEPVRRKALERDRILDFAEQVIKAWLAGTIEEFVAGHAAMPPTAELARRALNAYLAKYDLTAINPFLMEKPGDALREISRSIEWELFREFQRRERSVELIRTVLGDIPHAFTASDVIRKLIDNYQSIDALMLSASQQRKSRAGYSYEHHIEAMLSAGKIPFEKQVVIESKKRPDFVLPSLAFIDSGKEIATTGLILSAKTTLRERWKQVEREKGSRRLFLTTVDENIAANAIEDMASIGIYLVIPESLMDPKGPKITEYFGHKNVLTFKAFCSEFLLPYLPVWRL